MKHPRSTAPAYSLLNPSRPYTPAAATDVRATIARARRQLAQTGGTWFGRPPEQPQQRLPI